MERALTRFVSVRLMLFSPVNGENGKKELQTKSEALFLFYRNALRSSRF
jgi:hypothetical protein